MTSEHLSKIELPDLSALPPPPWRADETDFDAGWYVENDRGSFVCEVSEEVARAIASIPAMVEEIERLREERDSRVSVELLNIERETCDRIRSDNDRLCALNAELLISAEQYLRKLETLCSCAESSGCKDAARRAALKDLIARAGADT